MVGRARASFWLCASRVSSWRLARAATCTGLAGSALHLPGSSLTFRAVICPTFVLSALLPSPLSGARPLLGAAVSSTRRCAVRLGPASPTRLAHCRLTSALRSPARANARPAAWKRPGPLQRSPRAAGCSRAAGQRRSHRSLATARQTTERERKPCGGEGGGALLHTSQPPFTAMLGSPTRRDGLSQLLLLPLLSLSPWA